MHETKQIHKIQITRKNPKINHIFYTDNTILFSKTHLFDYHQIRLTLKKSCIISDQQINPTKSFILFNPNIQPQQKQILKYILNIPSKNNLKSYLNIPINFNNRKKKLIFTPLIDKTTIKISSWNSKHLPPSAKLLLINTILTDFNTHIISIYLLPKNISNYLNSIITTF